MKIQAPQKNKKFIISAVIITVLLIGLGVYLFAFKGNLFGWQPFAPNDSSINYDEPTEEQLKAGKDIEESTDKNSNSGKDPNSVGSDHPNPPVTQPGDDKATASLTISSVNQNDGKLQIRTLIGALTSEGTCTLTLTKDSKTVTRSAGVQATSNSTTCKGFDVPVSELSTGEWQATIKFENDTLTGSGTKQVTVL